MWKNVSILIAIALALVFCGAAQAGRDVTGPLDTVTGVPEDGIEDGGDDSGWPPNELPPFGFDDQILTKFLHFKGNFEPTGLRVTPAMGPTVVTGLTFTTANDAETRDPVEYELSGSNESIDGPYTLIAAGPIVDFAGGTAWPRRTKNETPIEVANTVSYKHYRIMFPVVRDPGGANSMQIAEVELLAPVFKADAPIPADAAVHADTWVNIDPAVGEAGVNRIFDRWIDGFGTATNGALVGNDFPPYAETDLVHGGSQSMIYRYDNNSKISEATLTLVFPTDWTEQGVTKLSLWALGASGNDPDRVFVALNGNAVAYHNDTAATQTAVWKEWVIDLTRFAGADLANINTITIGIGTRNVPGTGAGTMYFDDIRLVP
ncbi:MAG: hypothetical protein ISS70_22895 [Phycisphaerae bacterium]|nr:hypothetical protein [Phycisphaerae bacterium]